MPAPRKRDSLSPPVSTHVRFEDCWAKTTQDGDPGIRVREHCLNVGCVAEALLKVLPAPLKNLLPPSAATLAALHDIGKVSPGFQQKCDQWQPSFPRNGGYEARHQRISQVFLELVTDGRLAACAEAIGAHHGRVQGSEPPGDLGGPAWEQARRELLAELVTAFEPLPQGDARSEAAEWLLAGLITLADWLGSDENNFSPENRGTLDKASQLEKAKDIVQRLELTGAGPVADKGFEQVFAKRLNGESPRPLQRKIVDAARLDPGVYIIEDVMGSGKTEAALWLAYRLMTCGHARGLYFGLPTRVTSDRIHRRVLEFLNEVYPKGGEPPLVHGHAWLREIPSLREAWKEADGQSGDETPRQQVAAARTWFASSRRGLLAPFAVGTVDQALLGVIAAKWFFLRQFALAGKVVVLDEVHSYDLYTTTLIQNLVKRLRELHATPVILSATLTAKQRAALLGEEISTDPADAPYPAVVIKTNDSPSKLFEVAPHARPKAVQIITLKIADFERVTDVVPLAARLAAQGRNVVWIRNTVRHARDAYRLLRAEREEDAFELGLLHSRFPAYQRGSYPKLSLEELKKHHLHEERWLWMLGKPEPPRADARPHGCVLVATQVVEQSVDIDADVLITDLAPTDMLLQRLGRLHRHERGDRGKPVMYLVIPRPIAENPRGLQEDEIKKILGGTGKVYAPYVLLRTWQEWQQVKEIVIPNHIRGLLERTYQESPDEPAEWKKLYDELAAKRQALKSRALAAIDVRGRPLAPDEEEFGTRSPGQRQILLLLASWVSLEVDRAGNWAEIRLLNGMKLTAKEGRHFNIESARKLHLNVATIPAWWLPKRVRNPLPPILAQYFSGEAAIAVRERNSERLRLDVKNPLTAPSICYDPLEGLWLERPPTQTAIKEGDDGERDDGMF